MKSDKSALGDDRIHVRFKLSALWTSLMFFYIYNDYLQLYQPGKLGGMLHGKMDLFPVTQATLFSVSLGLAIPALMISLSLVLRPNVTRWLSITFGTLFTAIDVLTMLGSWWYYIFFNCIETVLTLSIIWYAWNWPRDPRAESAGVPSR